MFARNGFSLTFLLASVLIVMVIVAPTARAECDCEKPENEQQERQGWDKILHKTLCGVKGVAKTVTDKVKDGYHYVEKKLSSSGTTQPIEITNETVNDFDLRSGNTEEPIKLAN